MNEKNSHLRAEQIQAILDQNINNQAFEEIKGHLATCPKCQEEIDRQQKLISRLENLPEISLDKDLSREILSQIQGQKQQLSRLTLTLIVEAVAAGAVIGALVPVLQAAAWIPRLAQTQQQALTAINIFLTQLASTWFVWWAQLQLDIQGILQPLISYNNLPFTLPSPWILILAAGGLGFLINILLLRHTPIENHQ